ncbi:MAG: hypothetical protein AMJ73_05015 [candidate division Zixibacteria bacterium SM1_73]|nr:MAG: hypothetical protein AMJ73_05015 [candidate division Zixibacteria bacterium SM1_73]
MKSKKFKYGIDPVTVGRQAHARVFDQPVTTSADLPGRKLQEFILQGRPAEFRKWLKRHDPDWEKDARAQYCVGASFKADRQYNKAEKCYKAALQMWQAIGDPKKVSFVLQELSVISLANDDHKSAWHYLNDAMKVLPNSFTSHYNRLCLASMERDEKKLRTAYQEMSDLCKKWYQDPNAEHLFLTDGELQFLRDEVPDLWQQIKKQTKRRLKP